MKRIIWMVLGGLIGALAGGQVLSANGALAAMLGGAALGAFLGGGKSARLMDNDGVWEDGREDGDFGGDWDDGGGDD